MVSLRTPGSILRMMNSELQGRRIVVAVVVITILMSVATFALRLATGTLGRHPGTILNVFLTAGLMQYLWKGHVWARWTTALLMLFAGVFGIVLIVARIPRDSRIGLVVIGLLTAYCLAAAGVLIASSSVKHFLEVQRSRAGTVDDSA